MNSPDYVGCLLGDISAITASNRDPDVLRTLLQRDDWLTRLINGSDYPLPAVMPLFSPKRWVNAGLLNSDYLLVLYAVREANPLFDFMLKHQLNWKGHRFAISVFQTRPVFDRAVSQETVTKAF